MGAIANKFCEKIYITDDNPRNEDPKLIRSHIKKGLKQKNVFEIPSRSKAISLAVENLNFGIIFVIEF